MKLFTTDNTYGYSANQLDLLNAAAEIVFDSGKFDLDDSDQEHYVCDQLQNALTPKMRSASRLVKLAFFN